MGSSQTGVEPMSPALAGGLFTTKPPGKSYLLLLILFWIEVAKVGILILFLILEGKLSVFHT